MPAGVELYVQIKTPITVYGVKSTGDTSTKPTPVEQINPTEPTTPQLTIEQPPAPPEPSTPAENELSPDEMTAKPPEQPTPHRDDEILVQVDKPEPPAPAPNQNPPAEPRPDEGKTLDGQDGEIIEIFDEE